MNHATDEVTTVKAEEKIPMIHHITAFFTEDAQLVFNIVKDRKKDTTLNTLHLLEPTTMKEQVIDQNTFSPNRLIDLQHHNEYDYDGSMVFLSKKGIA